MASRGRPPHPDVLTPREWEVLALLREGLSNREIGRRLAITERTARFHVSEILSKLGVATREEAASQVLGERRRWWMAWPLWAKIAGAAAFAASAAGLAVLAWGYVQTEGSEVGTSASVDSIDTSIQAASPLKSPPSFDCSVYWGDGYSVPATTERAAIGHALEEMNLTCEQPDESTARATLTTWGEALKTIQARGGLLGHGLGERVEGTVLWPGRPLASDAAWLVEMRGVFVPFDSFNPSESDLATPTTGTWIGIVGVPWGEVIWVALPDNR